MDDDQLQKLIEGDEMRKFTDYFSYKATIGQGAFGIVVSAVNLTTQQEVAIKKKLVNRYDQLKQESTILASLRHENIVKFIDVKETDTRILIIMELIQGGSLEDLMQKLQKSNNWFTEDQCKAIIRNILQALAYMHKNNVVHRDLKPENILVNEDLSCVKLSDFGLSSVQNQLMTKQCGTLIFMAPELLMNKIYSKNVDIWGVGVIMFMLLNYGQHPYYKQGDSLEQILQKTKTMHEQGRLTQLQYSLFKKLTELDQTKRYRADQGLLHPWLNEQIDVEIPQTMEEIFHTWIQQQKLLNLIKSVMCLSKMGYMKKLENREICNRFSEQKNKLKEDKNKKEGKLTINKEFYDELFEDYQKTLTEHQRRLVLQTQKVESEKQIKQQVQSQALSTVQAKLQFIIRARKPTSSQKNVDEPVHDIDNEVKLEQNESQPDMLQLDNELQNDTSAFEKSYHDMSMQINPIVKSPKKKRKSPLKTQTKLYIQKNESINNSQQGIKEKPSNSQVPSPTKLINTSVINSNNTTKHQIRLKPLQTQIEPPKEIIANNTILNQYPTNYEPNFRSAIRPIRQSHVPRLSRLSVDRDQVQPAVLDLSSMAMGGFSPVHSNQFLFPSKIPSYCPQKRVYQNEFHPSKVLQSLASKKSNDHYNFINGGPK
ncbi:unnamed protein product (macronuclear) [Paramecium tetraurelia]|uniref:Protein kinase domain-containing protein n=1 Tax=Paramecium tetraurelia TaxID=5888 RepID=A0E169_PARTE|nr:uncharacterized protein GSPATT00022205001 [Paramecium tetraurelia]CAK89036.1 unnamed protein product [Paramecium tetraurelia]|eukprot:XP_001456433.1 hypothetical protein (macronuclear) [Paramecium tetraurelia strain d4-2]